MPITLPSALMMVPIAELKGWKRNPRRNDHAVDRIAESIQKYGMNAPILINAAKEVIAGNTRLKACHKLGLKEVPCIDGSHLTQAQAISYNVADNKLAELASWDDDLLLQILDEQTQLPDVIAADFGYTDEELGVLLNGWNSEHKPADDVPEDGLGRVVVSCAKEDVDRLKADLASLLQKKGFTGAQIK